MKGAIFAFSRQGCHTARRIREAYQDVIWSSFTMERFGEADFSAITPKCYGDCFAFSEILVFVGSCGPDSAHFFPWIKIGRAHV